MPGIPSSITILKNNMFIVYRMSASSLLNSATGKILEQFLPNPYPFPAQGGGGGTLSATLALGNTSGPNDIQMLDGIVKTSIRSADELEADKIFVDTINPGIASLSAVVEVNANLNLKQGVTPGEGVLEFELCNGTIATQSGRTLTVIAPEFLMIEGKTIIRPEATFLYPNNPEIGLTVEQFVNPSGSQQIGVRVDNIQSAGQADGLAVFNVKSNGGNDAYGIRADTIGDAITTTAVFGMELNNLNGAGNVLGANITGVNGNRGVGVNINGVSGGGGRAFGIIIDGVANTVGSPATGLLIENITSVLGGQGFGVVQTGVASGGNIFESKIEVGVSEPLFGGLAPSLSVAGTVLTSVQLANPASGGYVIEENAGNICVASGVNNHFVMPAIQYTGAKYTIIKTIPGSIAINGGLANINGVASPPLPGGQFTFSGPAYSQMQIVWIGTEWVATLI